MKVPEFGGSLCLQDEGGRPVPGLTEKAACPVIRWPWSSGLSAINKQVPLGKSAWLYLRFSSENVTVSAK